MSPEVISYQYMGVLPPQDEPVEVVKEEEKRLFEPISIDHEIPGELEETDTRFISNTIPEELAGFLEPSEGEAKPVPEVNPYLTTARQLILEHEWEKALPFIKMSLNQNDDDGTAWLYKGIVELYLNQGDESEHSLQRAVTYEKTSSTAHYYQAYLRYRDGKYAASLILLTDVLKENPAHTRSRFLSGLCKVYLQKYNDAFDDLEILFNSNRKNIRALLLMAYCRIKTRRYIDAISLLDQLLELREHHVPAWEMKSRALLSEGRYSEAVTSARRLLSLSPHNHIGLYVRTMGYIKQGLYEDALKSAHEMTSHEPLQSAGWTLMGLGYMGLDKYQDALKRFDRAQLLNPNDDQVTSYRVQALRKLKRYGDLLQFYAHVTEENPEDLKAWYNKGVLLHRAGKFEEAIQCYDRVISKNPREYRAILNKGKALQSLHQNSEAIKSFQLAISVYGESADTADAWYHLGQIYTVLVRLREALTSFDQALALRPEFVKALVWKAHVMDELGMKQEAFQTMSKARRLDPSVTKKIKSRLVHD